MDVLMPDGTTITGVPEGITQSDLLARYNKFSAKPAASSGLASLAKPEPTLSPEEQMMGSIGAASAPQERLPRPPEGQFELRPYEPSLTDQLMELLPGNKYKAANEYAARQIAKEQGVPVGQIYKDIGGARPMFNPEGRAPIRAGVESAKIVAGELPKVPEATLSTFLKAYRSGDIEAPTDVGMVDKAIAAMKPTDAKGKPDPNYEAFQGLGESLGFSLATMVTSATAAAAGEVVAGPVGGVSAGMAASGAMAYRASKDDFLSRVRDKLNGESQKLYGTNISPEDWNKAKKEFDSAAMEYGVWEAIPEAVSNAVFLKAFAAPAKAGRGAAKIGSFLEKVGAQGVEQATETMTALGQNAAEKKAGLSDEDLTIADAFRQQFIQTLLIGGTMAGGMKAKEVGDKFYREVVEPRVRPGSALAKAIQADVDAVAFNPESTRKAAVEALNPNRAQKQVVAEPGIASLIQKQQIAMPPPPEEPEEEILAAPPSKSQDTQAMLEELINSVNYPQEKAPEAVVEKPTFDATGWTKSEKTINKKTGELNIPEGVERYTKEDEDGTSRQVLTRNGEVTQSETTTPTIELTNSVFGDEGETISGRIKANDLNGTLYFFRDDNGQIIKMSPRASQQYKEGVPVNKIAELEFSDAGGIRPDGTKTPHTTTSVLVGAKPKPAAVEAPPSEQPPSTQLVNEVIPDTNTVSVADQTQLPGRMTVEVPVGQLQLSEDVPQFKTDANKEGIVEPLGGKFERTGVAPIQVWRREDGRMEVISGRHRFDLAKRSGEETIPAQIHDEKAGFTKDMAAVLDAELNIRDGQGKVKDYVNYFKGTGLDQDTAESRGLLARSPGKRAFTIANQGSDELIAGVRSDKVGDEAAYLIALNAPNDSRLQGVGIKAIQEGKSSSNAVNLMQAVKALASEADTTTDMFGFDDSAMKEAEDMAKIAASKQREVQTRLSAITGAAKNPAVAKAEGIDVRDPEAVKRRINELRQLKTSWDNWSTNPNLISEIRTARGAPVPELQLRGETEAEIRQREATQERDKAAAEQKAIADREVDMFKLQPQVAERGEAPTMDMFGAADMANQPAQTKQAPELTEGLFAQKPKTEQERTASMPKKQFREDKETRGKTDHPALKMVFKGQTPKGLIEKYGEKDVRFLGRLFDIDVKDKFNVAKKLIAINSGLDLVRGKTKDDFDKMNKEMLGGYLEAIGQSKFGRKYEMVERLLKHEDNIMGKFNDNLQDLKHKAAILNEARAGKPVSEEVLKDYPDVAAYTLPRGSDGYKDAVHRLAIKYLPTHGMDTPSVINSFREDAKNTKDALEKNVANDIADDMEKYYQSQQKKSNETMAKLGDGTGPTMGEMIAENKRVKAELAALEKGEFNPVQLGKEFPEIGAEAFAYLDTTNAEVRKAIGDLYKEGDIDGAIEVLENMPKNTAVVEKQVDNKKEIADLRKEQKALMMQIVKAGMEETPVQEARMAEIEKRIAELEGKPVKAEKPKDTRSVEDIKEKIEDLEDKLANEFNKDKRMALIKEIGQQQTDLGAAEYRAAQEAEEEPQSTGSKSLDALRGVKFTPDEDDKKAIAVYKQIKENNPEADVDDDIANPNSHLPVEEKENAKGIKIGDLIYEKGDPNPSIAITVSEDRVATVNPKTGGQDGSKDIDSISKEPIPYDFNFDFGYGEINVNVNRWLKNKGEWSVEMQGPGASETGYRSALGLVFKGERGTPEFENWAEQVVRAQTKEMAEAEKPKKAPKKKVTTSKTKEAPLSLEYTKALDESREATKEFSKAQEAYRAQEIDDDEFLIARKKYDLATAQFDQAFKQEQNRPAQEVADEVLPAEEKEAAGLLENEPYTIEGDFTEVAEEQQRLMLEDQTENLSDDQVSTLEKHYGAKADSDEFFTKLREDVTNFIVKGATAVNGKIRAIIRQLANGVLAVGIAFNPQYMSQPINVFMPVDNVRTEEVLATVPDAATDKMSEPAKRAFAVIYPALQEQMVAKDKLFIMADKPSGRVFVFNPDGSLLLEKKSLFGLAKGDLYVGDNDKPQNRITPAGLFDLKFVDAQKGAAEKRTAGDYDTGTVLAINDPDGTITIMHSVWLKEKDAAQRAAALRNESPADSRYSFGCINVDAPTYKYMVDNHAKQMDGAALFIVPEAGVDVMSFITGKGAMSEDLARIKIKPVTKEVRTPQRQATQAEAKTKTPGREQQFFSLESPNSVQVNGRSIPVTKHKLEKNNQIVEVNVNAFDNAFAKTEWQYIGEGGKGGIGGRYKNFSEFIKNAKSIEAPNVAVNKDGTIVFGDGRHRYAYLRDVGVANIPLSMDAESIRNAQKFGYISEPINKSLGDDLVKLTDQMAGDMAEDEKKRSPSLIRKLKTYNRQRKAGKMSNEMYVLMTDAAIQEDYENDLLNPAKPRQRGYLHIQERLSAAVRRGDITREAYDLANWFMQQNEALVDDLGISIKANKREGTGGFYNNLARIFTLIKEGSSDLTTVHEILHHLERMMPLKIQQAIRKAWLTQLTKAAKATKDPVQKLYFEAVLDANFGDNKHAMVNIPEGAGVAYSNARMALEDMARGNTSVKLAEMLLLQGAVPLSMYQFFNPSEFWAVNGSRIVEGRFEAVKGGTLSKLKNWLRELGQTIKSIFGLKSDASIIRALDSLAKSDGKFVTDEMLGVGDYQSIERRNYEGGEAPEPDMEIPEMSFMDDVIYKYGDKLIDTKRLIQSIKNTGKKLNEQFDAYMKEENYHGRLAKRTSDFLNDEMRPVLQDMQDKNVSLDELETFLLNRHAKEANAYIARINPTGFPEAGSSVSDAAADKYMAELTPEKRKDLMALAAKVDAIVKETQRVLVANGLETQDTIKEWNATYKNYVPLMRDQLDFVHTGRGVMGGFATRGSASKRRVGSDKPVIDIFANIAMQRERALRRSEQARVGRALYGMAIKHPNPGFWLAINPDAIKDKDKLEAELISLGLTPEDAQNIIQEPRQPMFDKKTGTVKYQVNPLLRNSPNVFPVRINGEDRFIFFNPNDPRALRMVESIKNLDTEKLGDVIGTVGMVTRWFASVNTQYNIVFGGVNFLRDLGAASLNLSTTEIAGKEKQVRANVLPALRAIYRDLRGKGATTKEMAEMQNWFERFQLAGGQTGYQNQFAETKRKGNVVEQELKRLNRGNVKKSVDAVFDWLSDYNDAIENAVRLSAFKVAVESGLSEDKAASIAKNLTVNFNRKGARTGLISSLYAFFNAAIQGSARMVETLRGPMGKKIIFGGMFLGSMQAIALAMAGFDDDEPPEFVKDKNLIIPIPYTDKKYLSIPMPLGFNMFPGFGRLAMETLLIETGMIRSRKGPGDKVMSAVSLVFDAFNPLGGAGNPLLMAMPTILDPFAAIYSNKDAFGRPIYREDKGTAPTPGYERSRENASVFSKKLAEAINWATSPAGTQHTKGFFSPTADQIDYFIGQVTGGVGRELMKVGEFAKSKAVTQEEIPAYKLPIVGRFYGEAESPAATRSRFYENVKEMAKHEHEIKGLRKDRISPTEYIKANPEARLWQRANNVENQISKLNKEKRAMIERDAPREALKRKEDEILKKMTEFNDQVRRGQ